MTSLYPDREYLVNTTGFAEELNLVLEAPDNATEELCNDKVEGFWQEIVDASVDINIDTERSQPLDVFQMAMDLFQERHLKPEV